jgi:two-component system nitrogen regulation sensor histidine kinase NtrY
MGRVVVKRENIILFIIGTVFSLYFVAIIYLLYGVKTKFLFEAITRNRLLLISLVLLFVIMFFLFIYNIMRVIIDRMNDREGSKFRLRLTLLLLLVTLIPIVPLSIISNKLISQSINLWFLVDIEHSLVNALEVSKELYGKFAGESLQELERTCEGCTLEEMGTRTFEDIDGVVQISDAGDMESVLIQDTMLLEAIREISESGDLPTDSWKRIVSGEHEYLLVSAPGPADSSYFLLREIPDYIRTYTTSISTGLQNYRTLKIFREPIRLFIFLFYLVITMPFVLLSFYLSLIISRQVTVPIRELALGTQHVAEDDLDYTISVSAKDELKLLIDSFNRMTHDLKLNKELLKHSERSAAWRDIARRIAHEIKNPLTPIKLSAERLLKQYNRDDSYRDLLAKGIQTIIMEVENLTDMVNEFSHFSRFPETMLGKHDIIRIIEDIVEFLRNSHQGIDFQFSHVEDQMYLLVDGAQIRRAILNVTYNSINAIRGSGVVSIRCYPSQSVGKEKDKYIVSISDNGRGIDETIRDKIFDPYFSANGEGSGLGLAIVEKIVLDNRGRIWFESEPGNTTFYMEFQRA